MNALLRRGNFQTVLDFRRKWSATHKLDQDKVVSRFSLVHCSQFCFLLAFKYFIFDFVCQ